MALPFLTITLSEWPRDSEREPMDLATSLTNSGFANLAACQQLAQHVGVNGLYQKAVESRIPGSSSVPFVAVPRDRYQHQLREPFLPPQSPGHLIAVHPRQSDLHQH